MTETVSHHPAIPRVPEIKVDEILARRRDSTLHLVNVLPRAAFEAGHIPGSVNLPAAEIENLARTRFPDLAAEIATYCGSFT